MYDITCTKQTDTCASLMIIATFYIYYLFYYILLFYSKFDPIITESLMRLLS